MSICVSTYWIYGVRNSKYESTVFWDVKTCALVEINLPFGGTYCLHLQGSA
jgi:hypothetical protein